MSPQPPQPPITTTLQTQSNANFQPKAISTSASLSHSVQNYVKELEISEGQLSSCIKSVYENKKKEEFMKSLENRVKQYDLEIEKLCNTNYQSFVETFNELLSVREDTAILKNQLIENNKKIQKIGNGLIVKVEELVKETKKQTNVLLSIEALNKYMPVFNIYRQLKQQMQEKNYYPALKLLEDLENNYLPIVKQYRFSKSIHQAIPLFKEEIKAETITDLKNFLESVRIKSEHCGKLANQQMATKLKIDKSYYLMENELTDPNAILASENNMKKLPFDSIDFSPLYRNLHMNQVLGSKAFFADYYRNQRRKQLQLHLQPSNMNESLDSYKRYFHMITGFFVIEDQILSSTEGLVDERYLDDLFSLATPRLISVIRKVMDQSKDAELMLKFKITVVLFCQTIEEVQFPTVQLSDLLKEIREKYYQVLLMKWNEKIKDILKKDNYSCMEIEDPKEYDRLMKLFPCQLDVSLLSNETNENSPKNSKFIKRLPYSACVPKIFIEIKEFVNNCAKFAEGLNSSQTELDDMIRKPTNKLITDKLNENIRSLLNNVSLAQLVQIVVNTTYLEKSIELLEQHLLSVIDAASSKQSGKLQGISVFKDLRSEAESKIYDQLDLKIDELLDLENFNWLMNEIQGQASDYMKSLLDFLSSILESFNHLPSKLAQTACISACKHVAISLMNNMTNPEIKAISFGAVEQLNLDLLQCEMFANTIKIKGLPNETISLCFDDIRQLIDLLLTKEWSIYLKDFGKSNSKYNRVHGSTALVLLEKLKEGIKKGKGIFARFDIGTRDSDMKLLEFAHKELKKAVQSNATF